MLDETDACDGENSLCGSGCFEIRRMVFLKGTRKDSRYISDSP